MKRLLIGFMIMSLSALAGGIQNKKTGDKITFNLEQDTLNVEYQVDGSSVKQIIELGQYENTRDEEVIKHRFEDGSYSFNRPYVVTEVLVKETIVKDKLYHLVFGVPLSIALETIFLPVTLPTLFIKKAYTKKDLAALQEAVSTDKEIIVNKRRFKRIIKYLNPSGEKSGVVVPKLVADASNKKVNNCTVVMNVVDEYSVSQARYRQLYVRNEFKGNFTFLQLGSLEEKIQSHIDSGDCAYALD